jgi:hypothetical protein
MVLLKKLLLGWNFKRMLFIGMGILIVIQAFITKQWFGIVLGSYFIGMGAFALGCASGVCYLPKEQTDKTNNVKSV